MSTLRERAACPHKIVVTHIEIKHLSERDGGAIIGHAADFKMTCKDCGVPFRFVGVPFGSSRHFPTASVDRLELRVPIEPELLPEILDVPEGMVGRS